MRNAAIKGIFLIGVFCFLAACGSRGELKKAPPMWGDAKAKYEAEQAQKAAEEKAKQNETKQ